MKITYKVAYRYTDSAGCVIEQPMGQFKAVTPSQAIGLALVKNVPDADQRAILRPGVVAIPVTETQEAIAA